MTAYSCIMASGFIVSLMIPETKGFDIDVVEENALEMHDKNCDQD